MVTFLRSSIFNLLFYGATAIACILCLPGLLLPKEKAMIIVHAFVGTIHFLEKHILGLKYEVLGKENLPKEGSFIIAAKHQSPYETFKLNILLHDPAIVLKQELLNIPLWGKFLSKIDPIAIDRSKGSTAMKQIIDGALHVKEQNRPIVIFPQGTRVYPEETPKEKPYKIGVYRMYEATELPIIPLALNTGAFWPRRSWNKKAGTVTFEFLPPIKAGLNSKEFMAKIQTDLENKSNLLFKNAKLT
jgi:1-acyl-sn-glycerol-3-phosphate acyltransferase